MSEKQIKFTERLADRLTPVVTIFGILGVSVVLYKSVKWAVRKVRGDEKETKGAL